MVGMEKGVRGPCERPRSGKCHSDVTPARRGLWFTCGMAAELATVREQAPGPSARELGRWRLIEAFQARLAQSERLHPLLPTWTEPQRRVGCADYLSLFLFGLLNPVVETMRGLCVASQQERVQREVCARPISLGTFSEAQAVIEPALLADVFAQLSREVAQRGAPARPGQRAWLVQDGSLFAALPRMHWALWRRRYGESQVRLHLTLDLAQALPVRAAVTPARTCERAAWRSQWRRGEAYVADRYYGEDYRLFARLTEAGVAFVVRLRDEAVIHEEEALLLGAEDAAAAVTHTAWARLGCNAQYRSSRVRLVWVQGEDTSLVLATNLGPEELSAGDVALLYRERWRVEVFFRWVKCLLGCRHWFAESPRGVTVQLYLALIAALLLQLYTGERPNRRMMEAIRFYLLGYYTLAELEGALARERAARAARKKS